MLKTISILLLFFALSCGQDYDYCVDCSNEYPFYKDSHLKTTAQPISTLLPPSPIPVAIPTLTPTLTPPDKPPPPPSSPHQSSTPPRTLEQLNKVIVFPVSTRRDTVVGFADEFLTALGNRGWKVLDSDTQIHDSDPLVDIKNVTGFEKADIVVFYMTDMSETGSSQNIHETWKKLPQADFLKASILEDFNLPRQIKNAHYFCQHADVILVRYPEAFEQIAPNCKIPAFHFPHSASRHYFQAKSEFKDKKSAVLLSGVIYARCYPLRAKAKELFDAKKQFITLREHPGYQLGINPIQEAKNYAAQISQHKIALTGAGMGVALAAPYILAKHFEIPATGSVMVTDQFVAPLMSKLGFIENEHYLASTPDTLEKDLERWLAPENAAMLEKIGAAGQKLVAERHTLEKRVEEFEKVIYHVWVKKTSD